jgi:putative SOS response-associated peptidase YedK
MCYSAMVEQSKNAGFRVKARVDIELLRRLFERRVAGEKIKIPRALDFEFLENPESTEEKELQGLIRDYYRKADTEDQQELFAQRKRLGDAERKLNEKVTKTAEKERDVATRKIDQLLKSLERRNSKGLNDDDYRIYPFMYSPLVVSENGERVVRFFRYHLRPFGQGEDFDRRFGGCYNARRDSLQETFFWKNLFGRNHGVMVITKFFENVPESKFRKTALKPGEKDKNLILSFKPQDRDYMLIPCLWDRWKKVGQPDLYSFALITDEPPKEISEAGHDRCPIFLKEKNLDAWLNPNGKSQDELIAILADRETPFYRHELVA